MRLMSNGHTGLLKLPRNMSDSWRRIQGWAIKPLLFQNSVLMTVRTSFSLISLRAKNLSLLKLSYTIKSAKRGGNAAPLHGQSRISSSSPDLGFGEDREAVCDQ